MSADAFQRTGDANRNVRLSIDRSVYTLFQKVWVMPRMGAIADLDAKDTFVSINYIDGGDGADGGKTQRLWNEV